VPRLVQCCQCFDNPQLLLEAAWALTNISSGTSEHTRVVIDNGAIPIFIRLISVPLPDVREQAVWALGNIAGDSTRCRDLVLSYNHELNMLPSLLTAMGDFAAASDLTMLRNSTWTISNLCRGKPPPRWPLISPALPALVQLIRVQNDEEVLVDACWAISYICEPPERIGHLLATGVLPMLVGLLSHASPNVQTPALRCVGNVAIGSPMETAAVLECGALVRVGALLMSEKKEIKKEACWMLSNITAGSAAQIDGVCQSGCIPSLIHLVNTEEFNIRKEAAYALCNACIGGSVPIVSGLVSAGILPALCSLLDLADAELILAVCSALGGALSAGEASAAGGPNPCVPLVDEAGGVDKLEALQMHPSPAVYERAASLIDTYFADTSAVDDALLAPTATPEGYVFGTGQ